MSTLKTNNAQIGQSATANQNFTLYQPTVPDGTVRLGVGNSGATTADALTVTNAGNATLLGNLTVSGAGTSAFGGPVTMGGIAAERIVQGTPQTTNGAASYGFTGIPSWVKKITFLYNGIETNSGAPYIQLGSGSYTTSGYNLVRLSFANTTVSASQTYPSGFLLGAATYTGGFDPTGVMVLTLLSPSSNTWVAQGTVVATDTTYNYYYNTTGYVTLAGVLDRIQIYINSGTFTSGSVNIIYEG